MKLALREGMVPGESIGAKFENARKLGYDGIEITTSSTREALPEIKAAQEATGVRAVLFSAHGGALADARREEREKAIQAHCLALELAAEVGGVGVISPPLITMKMQPDRPRIPDLWPLATREELERQLLVKQYQRLAAYAGEVGAYIIIEPLNRYEQWWPCTLAQAVELCQQVNHPHCRMMADFFHMNIEEADIPAAIRAAAGWILHVHVADNHRQTPGRGSLDLRPGFRALKDIGYEGFFGVECSVPGDKMEELRRTADYLRQLYEEA